MGDRPRIVAHSIEPCTVDEAGKVAAIREPPLFARRSASGGIWKQIVREVEVVKAVQEDKVGDEAHRELEERRAEHIVSKDRVPAGLVPHAASKIFVEM